jgi:hypothetical protein
LRDRGSALPLTFQSPNPDHALQLLANTTTSHLLGFTVRPCLSDKLRVAVGHKAIDQVLQLLRVAGTHIYHKSMVHGWDADLPPACCLRLSLPALVPYPCRAAHHQELCCRLCLQGMMARTAAARGAHPQHGSRQHSATGAAAAAARGGQSGKATLAGVGALATGQHA